MAKKNGKFDLNKGTERKFDIDKGPKRKFNLSKDIDDEAADIAPDASVENASSAPKTVVTPAATEVKTPEMQIPASTEMPDLSRTATDVAIEEGPAEPKRKNSAWLWALIGVAIVLAFIAMLLLRKSDDKTATTEDDAIENVETAPASAEAQDDEGVGQSEETQTEDSRADEALPETTTDAAGNESSTTSTESSKGYDQQSAAPTTSPAAPVENGKASSTAPSAKSTSDTPAKASTPAVISTPTGDLEQDAKKTIRGDYGDGSARKSALGSRYREVQRRVNQLMRSGRF